MAFTISRSGHARGRPHRQGSGIRGSTTAHSASVRSVSYLNPSRLCCRRVVGVHMALPGQASATPWNQPRPGHSTLFGPGSELDFGHFVLLVGLRKHLKSPADTEITLSGWE